MSGEKLIEAAKAAETRYRDFDAAWKKAKVNFRLSTINAIEHTYIGLMHAYFSSYRCASHIHVRMKRIQDLGPGTRSNQ
jgi:hypothetical protein